jgi:uncharacterized membrane protein YfcA
VADAGGGSAVIDAPFAAAGALTGFVVGLTGVGGGALMTPILLLFFGVPPQTAVATDLWFAAITKTVALPMHRGGDRVDWQVARRMWSGSLPASLAMVALVSAGVSVGRIDWLSNAVGAAVLVAALGLLLAPVLQRFARARRIAEPERFKSRQPWLTALAGALLGALVSLTSVGAGALGTTLMLALYPLRMTPQRLVATDIAHAIPLAMVGGSGYLLAGLVDGRMLVSMLAGSVPAVLLGSALATRLSAPWLRGALALVLTLAALKTLL